VPADNKPEHQDMANAKPGADASDEFKAELMALRADLAKLVETVKAMGREQADSALNSAREAVDHAAERIKKRAADAQQRGEAAAEEIEAMIGRHPLTSILVAVGLGYLIGRMRH
jgi:ElaB/YqjD/DUF883 family membrane-anchored ribosome-binding protein